MADDVESVQPDPLDPPWRLSLVDYRVHAWVGRDFLTQAWVARCDHTVAELQTAPDRGERRCVTCVTGERSRLARLFAGLAGRLGVDEPSLTADSAEDDDADDAGLLGGGRSHRPLHAVIFPVIAMMVSRAPSMVDGPSVVLFLFDAPAVAVIVSKVSRPVAVKARALMKRRCNHRWVRALAADSSRLPVRDESASQSASPGATVRRMAVSVVPNSNRWRVML